MVVCPIAIAVHCTGCPFVTFCPAKTILGDYKEDEDKTTEAAKADQNCIQGTGGKPDGSCDKSKQNSLEWDKLKEELQASHPKEQESEGENALMKEMLSRLDPRNL